MNKAFADVLACCITQHGESWLHPPLRTAFREMSAASAVDMAATVRAARAGAAGCGGRDSPGSSTSTSGASDASDAATVVVSVSDASGGGSGDKGSAALAGTPRSQMISFELWDAEGQLVAGEFGSVAGCSYTSFSGFYEVDGTGAVQMAMTAACLEAAGFAWWDMGQEHAYKRQHGASMIPRAAFLAEFRAHRTKPNRLAELLAERDGRLTHADLCMAGSGREARPSGSASRGRGCDIESYGF